MAKQRRLIKTVKRWSYSSWASWKSCPYRWWRGYVLGERQPPNAAMARGNNIHLKAEHYLKGRLTGPPPRELAKLGAEMLALRRSAPVVEQFWNLDRNWRRAKDKDSAWVTMKMDAAVLPVPGFPRLWIGDHKTGRKYPDHLKQGSLYACIGSVIVPETAQHGVDVEFWYVDLGDITPFDFMPRMIKKDTEWWRAQGEALMSESKFLPTPSDDACKWCHLRSDKGGPCKSWKALRGM